MPLGFPATDSEKLSKQIIPNPWSSQVLNTLSKDVITTEALGGDTD